MTDASSSAVILVVEDETELADLYTEWLADAYEVRTAYSGAAALEQCDDDVDVVLLDRRMPGLTGDEVLKEIRNRGLDCRVTMVTAVEPDTDIVEMEFDEYLVKPLRQETLRETVDHLVQSATDEVDEPILDALGNLKTRRCYFALTGDSLSAREVADETGYSLPTVYRHLHALKQAELIESQNSINKDGNHFQIFSTVPSRILIEANGSVEITVTHPDES